MSWPLTAGIQLTHLQTNVRRFHLSTHKWDLVPSPNCEYGTFEQTVDHILITCLIHRAPHRARGLTVWDHKN